MCGRYNLTKDPSKLRLTRPIRPTGQFEFRPRYNIAPGQQIPVLRDGPDGTLDLLEMKWGFVPHFIKADTPDIQPINARMESAASKPLFRDAWIHRRCLILATGFYEWQKRPGHKQPFHIHLGGRPFLMAGLWDYQAGDVHRPTVTILTQAAGEPLIDIHDRMPLVVSYKHLDQWLNEPHNNRMALPRPSFQADPISTMVNNVGNDGPEVLAKQ